MIIEVRTLGEVCAFILACIAVMTAFSVAHWKLFAAPIINRVLAPMVDTIAVNHRLLRKKFPDEYKQIEADVKAERGMRGLA